MQSAWIDRDAEAAVTRYQRPRPRRGLARLHHAAAGQDPRLVLHGGGNTSVKTNIADLTATRSK